MAIKKSELYSSLWKSCDELRGGMDASQYKDYVLVLLFVKYVSDKYAGQKDALLDVPMGGSFADMAVLKGDKEIGDKMNKIISRLAEANDLKGVIDVADFNDPDKLGKGQEMVDRLSNLVSIFDNPALDFRGNRAEGDDLLGDAYEYLIFGRYIHTYKFDEAVKDGVVLDLRYEARDIDQNITSQEKIDQWFEAKTKGLTDLAKAQLKQRWGTLQKVLSSQSRLEKIVADILMDMAIRDRLMSGRGNAMLVSGSIYEACKLYELFCQDRSGGQVCHRHLLPAVPRRPQRRGIGRGDDRETTAIRHLPEDAGRLVQRTAGNRRQQGRKVREGGQEEVHRRAGADEALDCGG